MWLWMIKIYRWIYTGSLWILDHICRLFGVVLWPVTLGNILKGLPSEARGEANEIAQPLNCILQDVR